MKPTLGIKGKLFVVLLAPGLTVGGGSLAAHLTSVDSVPGSPVAVQVSPAKSDAPVTGQTDRAKAVDLYGDPLPPGALMRLGSVRLRHALNCNSVAFSPLGDLLASGGRERVIRLWDPLTGKERRQILGPDKGVEAVAFSPDGKLLAGAGQDGVVYLWDAVTGQEVCRLEGHKRAACALAFSAKGNVLAVGDAMDIRLWDVASGKLLQTLEGKMGRVDTVALAPDGRTVAGASMGIWATASGKLVHDAPAKKPYARAVVFSKDGQFLVTVGQTGTVVWDTATGDKVDRLSGPGVRQPCVALSPDGTLLAIGGDDGGVRLWDWAAAKEVRQICRLVLPIHTVAFSRDGKTLATGGNWGAIRLWDAATGQPKGTVMGHQEGLTSVDYVPGTAKVATAGWDGTVRIWDARTGKEELRLEISQDERDRTEMVTGGFSGGVAAQILRHLVLSPDGKLMAVSRWDHVVMVWDTTTGKEVKRFAASRLAFSPDNRLIAALEYGADGRIDNPNTLRLYDRMTGKMLGELRGSPQAQGFDSPIFLPDSRTIIAIEFTMPRDQKALMYKNLDTQFVVWDVATGKVRKVFPGVLGHNHQLALSPDGRTLATRQLLNSDKGMDGSTIILWEIATGERRGDLVGHDNSVGHVAFAPDGRTVASASMDGSARLWDLYSGKEIGRLEGHRGWVGSLAFAPDGKRLVTGSTDSTALIWDISQLTKGRKSAELSAAELESCWKDLSGNAQGGYRAIGRLASSPKQAVALLAERLKPAPKADPQRITQLIADLDSERFKIRDAAMKELGKLGETASLALEKALEATVTLEKKQRLDKLLSQLDEANLPSAKLRAIRAVEALQAIGTDEARRLLEGLVAKGAPGARLTREAEAALRRLQLR
jgi:WD40 repeat protein